MGDKTQIFVFLIISINCVPGLGVPQPEKLVVNIMDGDVIVLWKSPADAPLNAIYNVQFAKYSDEWAMVASCTGITKTHCSLSSFIHDYSAAYKVKVQLVAGDDKSAWTWKKFLANKSELQPPSITLRATSSTLTVYIHEKPILKRLFPFGVTYTIYLEERGGHSKNTTAYVTDEVGQDQRTKTFSSLHWGREYCVSIKVKGNGALSSSSVSPSQCLLLPEREWFIIGVSSLSIMGVLAIIAIVAAILLCYMRRPEKTPAALKSPVTGWHPLNVEEDTMEVVTDKGWYLYSYRTEAEKCIATGPVTLHVTVTEDNGAETRRTSMDSGVSLESKSATNTSPPTRHEDSGCGSMGGPESSTSNQTDYPLQVDRPNTSTVRKREDSGVGLGCQLDTLSMNLDALDSEPLKQVNAGANYHSQSSSAVHIHVCADERKEPISELVLAEVITGYRAGPQSCICSGAGQCTWCHKQGLNETGAIKQYRSMCIENGLLSSKCNIINTYKEELTFSNYPGKSQTDTVTMSDFGTTFSHLGETFPLLTALSPLTLVEGGQDLNMNNVSLSLCDVQLTTD